MTTPATPSAKRVSPWPTVLPVWLLALVGAVAVLVAVPEGRILWLPIVFGVCILAAFGLQLAIPTRPGHVERLMWAITGALVILAAATAVFLPLALLT